MRRISAATLLALVGVLALAGCGGSSTPAGLSGTITFETWSLKNDKFTPYFNAAISTFEAAHKGTTINWIDAPGDGYSQKVASEVASTDDCVEG
jgi:multiple sugar transport system substrate-binding protein